MKPVTEDQFIDLVASLMDELPDDLAKVLSNVAITVEDAPNDGNLNVLALYRGTPLTDRGNFGAEAIPDNVVLYRESMLAHAHDEDQLKREVWNTLIREIGAHLGMTEAQLHDLHEANKR